MGHFGDGFLRVKWPKQQCQSTEGSSSPKDRLQSHQVHLTMLQYYTCMQYTVIHNTKMKPKYSEMGPVRQNPIQRTVRSVHMCVHCTVYNCCTQCTEQIWQYFPSYPPDNHHCSDGVYLREGRSIGHDDCRTDIRHRRINLIAERDDIVEFRSVGRCEMTRRLSAGIL